MPLPRTLLSTALLILVPAVLLSRWSRPRAAGLEQLMGSASLVQSFTPTPDRPVPALWSQRLGAAQALRVWQQQRRVWWQLWANQAESSPFLVIDTGRPVAGQPPLPPQAMRVGELLVVGEDATALRQLAASLRPLQRRSRAGLPHLCLQRLQGGQAVYWNAAALGMIVGQVSPLLERFQLGCLSLAVEGGALRWQGEAGPGEGPSALASPEALRGRPQPRGLQAGPSLLVPQLPALSPLAQDKLLEIEGGALDQLLSGLLDRPMIRDPLASRYGFETRRLQQARRSPFRLSLRPQPSGPFQASLDLQVVVGPARPVWEELLGTISKALLAQGLQASPALQAGHSATSRPPTLWRRADGVNVGGWRWIETGSGGDQLLFFLGPPPPTLLPIRRDARFSPAAGQLWMRWRPDAMASLQLLPETMPALLQRASQLWIEAEPLPGSGPQRPISRLKGRLQLSR